MATQRADQIAIPAAAVPPLTDSAKALRAALLVLEPWLTAQPPSIARIQLMRQLHVWRGLAIQMEQQVIAHEGT